MVGSEAFSVFGRLEDVEQIAKPDPNQEGSNAMSYLHYAWPKKIQTTILATLFIAAQVSFGAMMTGSASASTADAGTAGPNSPATVDIDSNVDVNASTQNNINITNSSSQTATSGDVTVRNNTTVGDVSSGDATNVNATTVGVDISNGSDGWWTGSPDFNGSVSTRGPNSPARLDIDSDVDVDVRTRNNVNISNRNDQRATTGDVDVRNNTTVGDVRSGDATNVNCTDIRVSISNGSSSANGSSGNSACEEDEEGPVGGGGQGAGPTAGGRGAGVVLAAATTTPVGGFGAGVLGTELANTGSKILVNMLGALLIIGLTAALARAKSLHTV